MKVLFIRHGQTQLDTRATMPRRNDPAGLTEEGKRQARAVAMACFAMRVQSVYCSPEKRARETAHTIQTELGVQLTEIDNLRERDWGKWSGASWPQLENRLRGMSLSERYRFVPSDGESWQQIEERLMVAIGDVVQDHAQTVAVITHGGALRALV